MPARARVAGLGVVAALALAGFTAVDAVVPAGPPLPAVAAPIDPASGTVSAYPMPGTPVASPGTQLSFRGAGPGDLASLVVTGARTGEHAGSVLEHGDGRGVSFVPDAPFAPGETVHVTSGLAVRGSDGGSYSFTVAVPAGRPELAIPAVEGGSREGDGKLAVEHLHDFASAPDLRPPQVLVTGPEAGTVGPDDDTSPGLTVLGVKNGYGQKGPMLVDDAGQPVWFRPLDGTDARDVRVQTLGGEPVITWWEGQVATGYGYGEVVVVDSRYEEVARVEAGNGYGADFHEILLTDAGTVLLLAYEPVRMDLSSVGGRSDGQVIDNVVQEVDIATGAVLFEWHGLGQVALRESFFDADEGDRFDYLHLNSVAVDDDGGLLLSARHTCAVYALDRDTGSVRWRLGGRASDLAVEPDAVFLKQHDARRSADGTLTLLDNGGTCGRATREHSRGIALDVDVRAGTASLVREHSHPDRPFSESQANYQELPGGDVMIGWGSVERWSLMDAGGRVLLDGAFPAELVNTSYRTYRAPWVGEPASDPAAVLTDSGAVHVSWNGATEVARWRVVDPSGVEVAAADRDGFETALPLDAGALEAGRAGGLRVEALDADGAVLGSAPVRAQPAS